MTVTVAQIAVKITADTKEAEAGLDSMNKKTKESGGFFSNALSTMTGFIGGAAIVRGVGAAVGFLKDNLSDMVQAGMAANQVDAQLTAGLQSTHDASGMTQQSLDDLSSSISNHTGITNNAVKTSEAMLLTFTNIGKNVFPQATQAVSDLATKMNGGAVPSAQQMQQASIQLGKALDDPLKGYTALQRVGVTFTEQQKEQIKHFMAVGDVAGAQNVILKEMNKEFGGSAVAAGQANGGMAILSAQMENMKETIGQALIPVLTGLMSAFQPIMGALASDLPGAIRAVQTALKPFIADLPQLWDLVVNIGKSLLSGLQPALQSIAGAFSDTAGPTGTASGLLSGLQDILSNLAPIAQEVGQDIGQGVQIAIPVVKQLWTIFSTDVLPIFKQVWEIIQSHVLPIIRQLASIFVSDVLPAVGTLAQWISQHLMPAISQFAGFVQTSVMPVVHTLVEVFTKDVMPAVERIGSVITDKLLPPLEKIMSKVLPVVSVLFQGVGWIINNVVGPAIELIINGVAFLATGISTLITWIGNLLGWFGSVKDGIGGLMGHLGDFKDMLNGALTDAINGIGTAFSNVFGGLWSLVKAPINLIIGGINDLIGGLDSIQVKIPDWSPIDGGKTFGINIPKIPMLATGGKITGEGMAMVGERGPELVKLPAGAQVTPNTQTQQLLAQSAITSANSHGPTILQIDGRTIARALLPYLVNEIRSGAAIRHT